MKTRFVLLAILILIIGFVLGMLTSARLRIHRLKPMRVYFSEERFREGFYKTIQPDEKQKITIDKILDKYSEINSATQTKFRKEFDSNMKSLRKELDANLTREQLARVKEMDEKRQEMMRNERKKHRNDTTDIRHSHSKYGEGSRQSPGGPPPYGTPPPDSAGYTGKDSLRLLN